MGVSGRGGEGSFRKKSRIYIIMSIRGKTLLYLSFSLRCQFYSDLGKKIFVFLVPPLTGHLSPQALIHYCDLMLLPGGGS